MFTLFGIVWYRIFLYSEYTDNIFPQNMHQFLLDKEIKINKSSAIGLDFSANPTIIPNYFINPSTLKINNIRVSHTKTWEKKLEILLTGLILTYYEMKRLIVEVSKDGLFGKVDSHYFIDLIYYQESRKLMAVIVLKITNIVEFIYRNIKSQESFKVFMEKIYKGKKLFDLITPQ